MIPTRQILHASILTLCLAGALAGCRGERSDKPPRQFLPDMDDSPKFKSQAQSDFFADGRTMRPAVEGTVAFGMHPVADDADRARFLANDTELFLGRDEDDGFIDRIPDEINVDRDFLLRGEERFRIYCFICHGYAGEGGRQPGANDDGHGGMVGRRWAYDVPTFHDPKYADPAQRTGKDGYLFDVIRHGVWDDQIGHTGSQKMPGYGHALTEADTWAIVAYLRALQAARVDADDVPADRQPANRPRPDSSETVSMAEEAGE